jgi:hypothetical protein
LTLFVDDEEDAVPSGREEIVLKRRRSEVGVDDVTGLIVRLGNPFGELERIGNGGGEENVVNFMGEEDDSLFPDDSTL